MNTIDFLNNQRINSKDIHIERFTPKYKEYYNDILSMEKELDDSHNFLYTQSTLDQLYQLGNYIFLFKDKIIGYARLRNNAISSFIIKEEYRGKGYGRVCFKILLDFIKNKLKLKYVTLMVRTDNKPARNLYYSFKFKLYGNILEGKLPFSKAYKVTYIHPDEFDENKEVVNQLKNIYSRCYSKHEEYTLFKNGILVGLDNNRVVSGCGTNASKFLDGIYSIFFYPAAISKIDLIKFINDAIKSDIYYKSIKYQISNSIDCKYYSIINKFGNIKSERLILYF